jgi:hypothetical protein
MVLNKGFGLHVRLAEKLCKGDFCCGSCPKLDSQRLQPAQNGSRFSSNLSDTMRLTNYQRVAFGKPRTRSTICLQPKLCFFQEYQERPIGTANVPLVAELAIATDLSLLARPH